MGDSIAWLETGHAPANVNHLACAFVAGREGERRRLIEAAAVVSVDEINPDREVAHELLELHHLGPAGLMDTNCLGHRFQIPQLDIKSNPRRSGMPLECCE